MTTRPSASAADPTRDGFDAFISYSRKDRDFAAKLEHALERFRPPRQLAVPQRTLRIFRDEGDMTGVEYYQSVESALARSNKLIVVCSPDARASRFVDDEIRRFAKVRGSEHVVPVLLAGLPNNEAGADEEARKAFPEALCELLKMPLATSYLGFGTAGGRVDRGAFEASWYTLLANLYGISREDVEQRERRRRRQRQWVVSATVATVMVALAALAAVAWVQKLEATRQRIEAERQRDVLHARQLAFQAKALLDTGIGDMQSRGTLLAIEAMRRWPGAEATEALQRVLELRRALLWQSGGGGLGSGSQVAFSPDGSRLVAVGDHGEPARVLDVATGRPMHALEPFAQQVAWSADGARIAGVAGDEVVLWSAADGRQLRRIPEPEATALAFSAAGDLLATASDGRTIRLRRVGDGGVVAELSRPVAATYPTIESIAFQPGGDLLAAVISVGDPEDPEGYRADIWSVASRRLLRTLRFDASVGAVSFSPSGALLAVGVRGTVRLIDTSTWRERTRMGTNESRDMMSVGFDQAGRLVAAVGWDGPAQVWRVDDGREVARLEHERGERGAGRVTAVALSPSGRHAATIGDDMLRMWELGETPTPADASRRLGWTDRRLLEFGNSVASEPGERGVVVDVHDRQVMRWQGDHATLLDPASQAVRAEIGLGEPITRGVVSPDGRLVALVGGDGAARVFDATSGRELDALRQASGVAFVALSGAASVAGFVDREGTLRARSTVDGAQVDHLRTDRPVRWIGFSPAGRWLLSSPDGTAFTVQAVATGEVVARPGHDRPASTLLFTADERYLATASDSDGTARIWDLPADRELLRWHLKTNLGSVEIAFVDGERRFEFTGVEYDEGRLVRSHLWRPEALVEAACRTVNRDLTEAEWRRYFPPAVPWQATCPARPAAPAQR